MATPRARILLLAGLALHAGACDSPTIGDAEGQAIVYGTVTGAVDGGPVGGARVIAVVSAGECGDAFRARPFHGRTEPDGRYRVHLRVLTRDPFRGCVEAAATDTVTGAASTPVRAADVWFALAPPLDSVRLDLELP